MILFSSTMICASSLYLQGIIMGIQLHDDEVSIKVECSQRWTQLDKKKYL